MKELKNLEELNQLKHQEDALLILFGGKNCNVCHSIKPKLVELMEVHYPKLKMVYIDCHVSTDICSQQSIFSLPVLQVYFTGQKFIEEVRSFSLQKVVEEVERPYQMLFS